jgi:hypothetical protein
MYIHVDSPQHYFIDNLLDCRGFLSAVQKILEPEDFLVFSSYASPPKIRSFLEQHQLEPDAHVVRERQRLTYLDDDYPDAFAVRWLAQPVLLDGLARLLTDSSQCMDLCCHVIAYGRRGALFSFHDAFQSDPLIISGIIPESQVREFCSQLGVTYKIQDRNAFFQ